MKKRSCRHHAFNCVNIYRHPKDALFPRKPCHIAMAPPGYTQPQLSYWCSKCGAINVIHKNKGSIWIKPGEYKFEKWMNWIVKGATGPLDGAALMSRRIQRGQIPAPIITYTEVK